MQRGPFKAIAIVVAMSGLTAAAQAANQPLATLVVAQKQTVRLGEPVKVSVVISNQTSQAVEADRSATAFDCFEVTAPGGSVLPYVGFDGQVVMNPVRAQPFSTVVIADALDLTDKYLFQVPGRYSIRFAGGGIGLSGSRAITLDIAPGRLSEFDHLAASLLPVRPNGWHLAKDARGEVTPFGRLRVAGFALHVCHNHMQGEAVYLWFTQTEARVDSEQEPRVKVQYLGRARGLYVYAAVDKNTPPLWPTATEDISRALQITNE
jgi:hypothetical protein